MKFPLHFACFALISSLCVAEESEFTMDSKDSRIYKGIAKDKKGTVPYQRKVAVYIPAQYKADEEVAFIVTQDGLGYVFAKNAGHTDGKVTCQTLPAALEWLW